MKLLNTVILLIAFCATRAQERGYKKIDHQVHEIHGLSSVDFQVDGLPHQVKSTKGSRILVDIVIHSNVQSEAVLNYLMKEGRYAMETIIDHTTQQLQFIPKELGTIVVKGKPLVEEISYIFYVPEQLPFSVSPSLLSDPGTLAKK